MTGLVAAGCVLVSMPLLAALLLAQLALERVTAQTEALVDEGVIVGELGINLQDQFSELERAIRQYLTLQDPTLLSMAERRWAGARETIQRIESRRLDAQSQIHAAEVRRGFADARLSWQIGANESESMQESVERLHQLLPPLEAIIAGSRLRVEERLQSLRRASDQAQRQMLLSAMTLVPLAALLAYFCSITVTRPLRDLYRTIAALGHGRYSHPVKIEFPREMTRLGEQLDWLRQRLAQLEADKDQFLRQVSHELKTPLASLREGSSLLLEGSLGELSRRQREVAGILAESTVELEALISNLLAYAEWRSERRHPERLWFDAKSMIDELLAVHTLPMIKRQLCTQLHLHDPQLFGQRAQLRLALDNLLTNAIKHAPVGSVIDIDVTTPDNHCELQVRDRGRGVPDEDKQRVFEPFVRGTEVEEQGIRGTGVGLSIVREVVLGHGGSVVVEDAAPGARFRLCWPCPRPQSLHAGQRLLDAEFQVAT